MRLVVSVLSSALVAGRAQDVTFALTLSNQGPRTAIVCAKDAPIAPLYELPRWSAQLDRKPGTGDAGTATKHPSIPIVRLFDPRLGAPSPPYVPRYLKEHGATLKSGATVDVRIGGCWLPRAALPDEARLRRLLNAPVDPPAPLPPGVSWNKGDLTHASLLVLGDSCASLRKALAGGGDDVLFGRAIAIVPEPGRYTITFSYDEEEAFGFVPAEPVHVAAPPVPIDVP